MSVTVRRFETAEDARVFDKGRFDVLALAGLSVGRARYEPGWRWSTHVGAPAGLSTCSVEHVGLVLEGRAAIRMDGGEEVVVGPGDLFHCPPGHDSWVVGDVPYVSLHFLGATDYAKKDARKP
jgi:mannose-6-phosphate isomerase-like protein (cupin superfamily)